jgi:hypothetical protein|tara:strand:- start:366 stop:554 length:189 start_codon:yes stop_codon:yes gene_type:complete
MVSKYLLKEVSDEALDLKNLIQKHKVDVKRNRLNEEQTLSHIENMLKISSIIYAKIKYLEGL